MTTNHPDPTPPPPEPAPSLRPVEELQALCDAATPGPWFAYDRGCGWEIYLDEHGPRYGRKPDGEWARQLPEGHKTDIDRAADAEFIAAARTALPALLARLRAAEETLAAVGALADRARARAEEMTPPGKQPGDGWIWESNVRAALAEGASR